ncbi:MAG: carboxypeptidase regulatory-like domain-containing protein [Clostridia bacterium]|nr:carboxypeptidase regulatory-like domain-containing protein [Clostridia bacterium]
MDTNGTSVEQASGYGYMIVRVTTARGAIPLENAIVTVHNYDPEFESGRGDVIAVYTTGASGLTDRFALPAPPRALSMSPGNGKSYETYGITVTKDGYHRQEYINVPVFEGITAIQNADMIPLPDNGQTDNFDPRAEIFFETENSALESGSDERDG